MIKTLIEKLRIATKHLFLTAFWIVFLFVVVQLFFDKQMSELIDSAKRMIFGHNDVNLSQQIDTLNMVYPDEPVDLEPTRGDATTRQRLNNIYETLVMPDRDLKIKPALAVNWGLIDDYRWEFRLRPDVYFHDGTSFEANDVVFSFDRAMHYEKSELTGVLSNIQKIEIINSLTVRIETKTPDPLLLQRLAMILMLPSEYNKREVPKPIGTGSYKFQSWDFGNEIVLTRNDDYWGQKAKFREVHMYSKMDKFGRVKMLFDGAVDFLAFVPYDAVDVVKEAVDDSGKQKYKVTTIPSLEVQFLIFNMDSPVLKDAEVRRAFSMALSQDELIDAVGGFARKTNQFVSSGIFGFSQYIHDHVYNPDKAAEILSKKNFGGKTVRFNLSVGLTALGDYVKTKLKNVGVNVVVTYMDGASLIKSMENKSADVYFMGFKSEMGDASAFLSFIAYSKGSYNFWGYSNDYVDKLIDSSLVEMDMTGRRKNLQEAMKVIVEDDILGVPLFEYETVFAYNDKIDLNPRIDGIILFDEIIVK